MPYRVRPIRWDLMVNPMMAGLQAEARAGENLGRSLFAGLASVGDGITRDRVEKESRRRFDAQQGLAQRRFDEQSALAKQGLQLRAADMLLEQEARMEKLREAQARETALADGLGLAVESAVQEAATTGTVGEETKQALTQISSILGGPGRSQEVLDLRAGKPP